MAEMKDYTKIMPISAYVPKTPKMSAANENFIQGQDRDGNFYFTGEMTGITFRIGDKVELGPKIHWGDNKKDTLIIHQFFTTDRYGFNPKSENNGKSVQFVYAGVEKGNWERQAHLNELILLRKAEVDILHKYGKIIL